MAATRVTKPKPVEATRKTLEATKPVKVRPLNGVQRELQAPAVRKSRASSCRRCEGRSGAQDAASRTSCERRARSSSTVRKTTTTTTTNWPRTNPDCRRAMNCSVKHTGVRPKCREMTTCPSQKEQQGVRGEVARASQSQKAFTVIPPNPKKRREIQRKAEAELAALEELRLSKAMAYVSINPSSVGGCMSLEEVRLKQQQEMLQAKRKQNPIKKQLVEQTAVLKC